jgi:hypothetical protein
MSMVVLRRVTTSLHSAYLAMELARFGIRLLLPMSRIRLTFAMRFVGSHMETNDIDPERIGANPTTFHRAPGAPWRRRD